MIRVREAIIVEGKYDAIKLSGIVDGLILETGGFRVFRDAERAALIRRLAETRGILVLTDSDGAGFLIRNHLSGLVPPEQILHAYIPAVFGKEKRKRRPSKEGILGVEGLSEETILAAIRRSGAHILGEAEAKAPKEPIRKADLYEWGLSGKPESRLLRQALLRRMELPAYLSANGLLRLLNLLSSYEEVRALVEELRAAGEK